MTASEKLKVLEVREQIQEDIMSFMDGQDNKVIDDLCQIVVDNFMNIEG